MLFILTLLLHRHGTDTSILLLESAIQLPVFLLWLAPLCSKVSSNGCL